MASLIDELIDVLNEEEKEYQDLILLSHKKTPVIVKGDLEKLQLITEAEQTVIGKINKLEKKRTEVVKDIALVLGRDEETIKVLDIATLLEGQREEQQRLVEVYERLRDTLKKMTRVNEMNKGLITESLEFVDFNLNIMKSAFQEPVTGNYTKQAFNTVPIGGVGVFDAKQ